VKKRAPKGKGRIELNGRQIPAQIVSGRSPIDPNKFIPVVSSGARAGAPIQLIRRTDLLPKKVPATVAAFLSIGDLLVDVFTPTYGAYYPIGGRNAFIFSFSMLTFTRYDMWKMTLAWNKGGYQRFGFTIVQGIQANYLRIQLGMTQGAGSANGAIIGVKVNASHFLLDLSHRSFQFFDLVLSGTPQTVEFSLSSQENPARDSILEIQQMELYDTIRTFPSDPPEVMG
jgi:hypothetical protein